LRNPTASKSKFVKIHRHDSDIGSAAEKLLTAKNSTQIMPRFELNLFSLRIEDNILSFRAAGSGASDCKTAGRHMPGGQAMESMENTRHQISLAARRA
jgi:hypothetical protein